jgi:hypothetical protein
MRKLSMKPAKQASTPEDTIEGIDPLKLKRMIRLESKRKESAEEWTSLSAEGLRRHYPQYVVRISPGRDAISLGNILKIIAGKG